ncbi:MAG TPA: peptide chain release factor N(5)-glutamine methyltransferase [Dehalococcoidia bacterium]|nr:peptide chain release factor N(5)-glutamine methyltransferase [Dehalococcoidia bacterium]
MLSSRRRAIIMRTESPLANSVILEAFARTRLLLERSRITDAAIEAEVLVRLAVRKDRARYFASLQEPLGAEQSTALDELVQRRLGGEPLGYIVGSREFYGMDFQVDSRVLIPRPETELLVDLALGFLAERKAALRSECGTGGRSPVTVADVCTGSGAVGIAIAASAQDVRVIATDISADAIDVAAANATAHSVLDRVELRLGDLLGPIPEALDLIVVNPPYIPSANWEALPSDVKMEPRMALDGGDDGLDIFRNLLKQGANRLAPNGAMFVELMPEQIENADRAARKLFEKAVVGSMQDLSGNPRVLTIQKGGK